LIGLAVRVTVDNAQLRSFVQRDAAEGSAVLAEWQMDGSRVAIVQLRANTPVRRGLTRESINSENTPRGFRVFFTAPFDKIAVYLERGTNPHLIFPSQAKVLVWEGSFGEPRFARVVRHPGTVARLFIARTREELRPVLRELYRQIWLRHH
jgi:hypothetical protein